MISGTFYTQSEAAKVLGRDRHTISRWAKEGKLNPVRLGPLVLIAKEEVDRLVDEGASGKEASIG